MHNYEIKNHIKSLIATFFILCFIVVVSSIAAGWSILFVKILLADYVAACLVVTIKRLSKRNYISITRFILKLEFLQH